METSTKLQETIAILPPTLLEGVEVVIKRYKAESGVDPSELQKEYIGGWFVIAFVTYMQRIINDIKKAKASGAEYTKEELQGVYSTHLVRCVFLATHLILGVDKSPNKTFTMALSPENYEPYRKDTQDIKCLEAVLIIRGIFENGVIPSDMEETIALLNAQIREYRGKGLIGCTPLEAEAVIEEALSLACGNFPEMIVKLVAQTTRKNEEIAFNKKGYASFDEEHITDTMESITFLSVEKDIKGVYAKLMVRKDSLPKHERALTIIYYVLHKVQETIYIKSKKGKGDVLLNINDLVGEGKPFSRKQYALEPFNEVIKFLRDIKYKSHYSVGSTEYRKLSISLLGRIDERKGDAIEEMNIFTSLIAYEDGTCALHLNDDIKDFSPIFHKIASLPFYGNKYNDREQALFLLSMYKYRSGKRKNSTCKIKNDDLMDFLAFGDISKERNKQRYLNEALRILKSVKEKDNKEYFEVFNINYNKKENTAYKMLKSMTVSIRIRAEKIHLIEGVKNA